MTFVRSRAAALIALAALPVAVLGVFFALPVAGMVGRGFFPDGGWNPSGAWDVLTRARTGRAVWFTLWTSTVAAVISVALGLPAAFALHRLRFWGRDVVRAVLLVPFVLPTIVVGVAFRQLLDGGTPAAVLLGLVFFNISVVIRTVGAAWESLDPRPGEAAAVLGASPFTVFRTVTWPALRPAIVSAAGIVFLFCATAFGIVLTLGGVRASSIETEVYLLTSAIYDIEGAAALSLLQMVLVVALMAGSSRLRRVADPTVARVVYRGRRPGWRDVPALGATAALLVFAVLPLVTLVVESLRGPQGWTTSNYRALSGTGEGNALLVPVTTALRNSLQTAIDATWIALVLGVLVAVVLTRRSRSRAERRMRATLDAMFMLPLGVSAVTLGFGLAVTLGRAPLDLRTWPLLVPIAQALVALPLVVRTLVPVLAGIDDRLRQAAASLGAGPIRAFFTVDACVLVRPLVAAAGFAFSVSLGEFGATSFLARPEHPTVPVVIVRLLGHPGTQNFAMAMAAAVILAATTVTVMVLVDRIAPMGAW